MNWITLSDFETLLTDDRNARTLTSIMQMDVESSILKKYKDYEENFDNDPLIRLDRDTHVSFLKKGLERLPKSYQCLDASQPWLCYWIIHSLTLMKEPIDEFLKSRICNHLSKLQQKDGGFGGGCMQLSHLATTYAAVNCLCDIGTQEAYQVINRNTLCEFIRRMHKGDGSFSMHVGGEADTRSVYCALSIAKLTGIFDRLQDVFSKSAEWIASCQTYEGGIGSTPGAEAHGGYTFCGFAALMILNSYELLDLNSFIRWTVNRQMRFEGGFQGRTNKLVDTCYSFWQGGIFPLLHLVIEKQSASKNKLQPQIKGWLYDENALQHYVLLCCQCSLGGIIDKPGKRPDYYHTCYGLSGLSSSQHGPEGTIMDISCGNNELEAIHPIFNVSFESADKALKYFGNLSFNEK